MFSLWIIIDPLLSQVFLSKLLQYSVWLVGTGTTSCPTWVPGTIPSNPFRCIHQYWAQQNWWALLHTQGGPYEDLWGPSSCSYVLHTLAASGLLGLSALFPHLRESASLCWVPPVVLWPGNPRQSAGSRGGFTSFVSHLSKTIVLWYLMPNVFEKCCFKYFICVCAKGGKEVG